MLRLWSRTVINTPLINWYFIITPVALIINYNHSPPEKRLRIKMFRFLFAKIKLVPFRMEQIQQKPRPRAAHIDIFHCAGLATRPDTGQKNNIDLQTLEGFDCVNLRNNESGPLSHQRPGSPLFKSTYGYTHKTVWSLQEVWTMKTVNPVDSRKKISLSKLLPD